MNNNLKDVKVGDVLFYKSNNGFQRNLKVISIGRVWIKTDLHQVNVETCKVKRSGGGHVWKNEDAYKKWFSDEKLVFSLRLKIRKCLERSEASIDIDKLKAACDALGIDY